MEIATPPIPEAESWSTIERLNRERELVGIYLSAHPLDDYEIILRNLCNTHCSELGDKVELAKKEDVVFGGIITAAGLLTLPDFMMLLGSTETILPHACAYARYILLAAPIMMSSLVDEQHPAL